MTRISKKGSRRAMMPRRPRIAGEKTGSKKDNLDKGFREHDNGLAGTALDGQAFFPKVR